MKRPQSLVLPLVAVLGVSVSFAAPRGTTPAAPPPSTSAVRAPQAPAPTLPERLERLRGTRQVDDQRLRRQFDQTVELLIELQQRELRIDAEFQREIRQRRTQRRTPLGQSQLNDVEPTHIPAVELLRSPWS